MGTEIEVHNAINIVGHGTVLIGFVRAGTARIGQVTTPLVLGAAAERRLEVSAVERLSSVQAGGPAVGLVFRDPPPLRDLQRALPAGSILLLEDPGEPAARTA